MAEVGSVLGGRYRLIELLGQGGMATIYRARDHQLERDVAVKVLRPEYGRDPDFGARFRAEAQAVASLNHPNIVAVHDYGQDAVGPFIVMELIDGEDLATVIRRTGALPPRQAARLTAEVARALAAAHGRGIVHRDVKPGNVMLSRDGRVKVTDFGIARAIAEAQTTLPGVTLGSVHYFSPEQARGEAATEESDIYALGIVLYELLTGTRPFSGDSAAAIALARLTDEVPSPSAVRAGIPAALEAIVRRALAPDPDARFRSAKAMAEALDAFVADSGGTTAGAAGIGVAGSALGAGAAAGVRDASGAPTGATVVGPAAGAAPLASGVARPNAGRIAYAPDAYAGRDEPSAGAGGGPPRGGNRTVDEPWEDDGQRRTSPWVWISALLALAILAVVGFLLFRLFSGPGTPVVQQVTVPNFVDSTYDEARAEAERLGIHVTIAETQQRTDKAPNVVLAQRPGAGGTIDKDGTVELTVNVGQQQATAPNLLNQPDENAPGAITKAGFTVGLRKEAFDPVIPAGLVSDQSIPPGTLAAPGTPLDYTVSRGPEPTPTPPPTPEPTPPPTPEPTPAPTPTRTPERQNVGDYRCQTLSDATTQITDDGFVRGEVTTEPDGGAYDDSWVVIDQSPAPGTRHRSGTGIDLTVQDPSLPCPPG